MADNECNTESQRRTFCVSDHALYDEARPPSGWDSAYYCGSYEPTRSAVHGREFPTLIVLDIEQHDQLAVYLRGTGLIEETENPRCETLPGGVSCRTVLVERENGGDIVVKQALEFLRVAEIWRGDPTRSEREAEATRALNELLEAHQVPRFLFEDRTEHVIAMTAVPPPHENWKTVLLRGERRDRDIVDFAQILGTIHRGAYLKRDIMAPRFTDRSHFETLRIDPYYRFAAESVPVVAPWFQSLIEETEQVLLTLVHGDFSPKNILLGESGCVLLDHEVAHWGDPAFDIGFATAHFLAKANHLPDQREDFGDAARLFWMTYCEIIDDLPWFPALSARAVRHSIGCVLARVCGKSPLEYLSSLERERQRSVALSLAADEPSSFDDLVTRFLQGISR